MLIEHGCMGRMVPWSILHRCGHGDIKDLMVDNEQGDAMLFADDKVLSTCRSWPT